MKTTRYVVLRSSSEATVVLRGTDVKAT